MLAELHVLGTIDSSLACYNFFRQRVNSHLIILGLRKRCEYRILACKGKIYKSNKQYQDSIRLNSENYLNFHTHRKKILRTEYTNKVVNNNHFAQSKHES